jgi:CBS domain-containing protein
MNGIDESSSEFEESYDDVRHDPEVFTSEILEGTLEALDLRPPICVSPHDRIEVVIEGMAARNQGCVLVREEGRLVGIFTERDVLRRVVGKVDPKVTTVAEVMTADPEAVSFHDTIATALNKMTVGGFRHVPLIDIAHRPVGVISVKDIVGFIVQQFPRQVLNVAPDPSVRHPDDVAGAG